MEIFLPKFRLRYLYLLQISIYESVSDFDEETRRIKTDFPFDSL